MHSKAVKLALSFVLPVLMFGQPGPAFAWDVGIGTNSLDFALYVGSGSGAAPSWTTVDERVLASDVPGPTVPLSWQVQTWDPIVEVWPADFVSAAEGVTQSDIYHNDVNAEFWDSGEAFVFGTVANGDAVGAGLAYDFELTLEPFTTATVVLDEFETYLYLESSPTDVGTAFAQAKLYQTDVDINDPGGANFPLAVDSYSAQAGDLPVYTQPSFSSPFVNSTPSPMTYFLRFEATVSVLEVPEPAMGSSVVLGALVLAGMGRGRRSDSTRSRSRTAG